MTIPWDPKIKPTSHPPMDCRAAPGPQDLHPAIQRSCHQPVMHATGHNMYLMVYIYTHTLYTHNYIIYVNNCKYNTSIHIYICILISHHQPAVLYVMGLAMDVTRQGRASTVPPPDGVELEDVRIQNHLCHE